MKAAIFDLDGTLVDSLPDIAHACNYALNQLGYDSLALDEYRLLVGGGNKKLMARALRIRSKSEPSPQLVEKAVELKMAYETGPKGHDCMKPFPGAHEMLSMLQNIGIQVAILSNKSEASVKACVGAVYPNVDWRYVAGAREDTPLKPDPTAALRIVDKYLPGVEPADCVFVGDTDYDMKTAIAAGMTPVGVSWGNRTAEALYANGAATVAEEAKDIADFVIDKMEKDAIPAAMLKTAIKVA